MARYEYAGTFRAALLDELVAAGIAVGRLELDDAHAWVTTDAERALVDPVVAAHDAAAIDAAAAAEQDADEDDRLTLRQVVATLLADADRLEDTTITMSGQVIRNHVARTDRAVARLLAVLRRRGVI
jgi:hypothetical protein